MLTVDVIRWHPRFLEGSVTVFCAHFGDPFSSPVTRLDVDFFVAI